MSSASSPHVLQLALGMDPLDRRAGLRDSGWSAVPPDRVVVLVDPSGRTAVRRSADGAARLVVVGADPATDSDLLLGIGADGRVWCANLVGADTPLPEAAQWVGLRQIGLHLADDERSILAEATALANWHRSHSHCPRCGTQTEIAGMGWWRTCPRDGSSHFPRTDPAIIALLLDEQDNALLGRQRRWPEGAFSTLAGFVEPGESAEAAVRREIAEEVGLHPSATEYLGSQPWPFPASLMLGFHASVPGIRPEPIPDGEEIVAARWIARHELPALCEAREVRLPSALSIAHHLIARWYGQALPPAWCRW